MIEGCPSSTQDAQFCNTFGKQNWRIYPIQTELIVSDDEVLDNSTYICYTTCSEIKFQR